MGKPYLPNLEEILGLTRNTKTGLPNKFENQNNGLELYFEIIKQLNIIDEQDAVNRYTWYNAPLDLSSQEIERLIYFKGQLCLFFYPPQDKFYLMPYALSDGIDFYGRYKKVKPIPITWGTEEKTNTKMQEELLSTLSLQVIYDYPETDIDFFEGKHCILLHDYTKQLGQIITPRCALNQELINIEAKFIPYLRTAILNSTGVTGVRASDESVSPSILEMSEAVDRMALAGKKNVAIVSAIELQELTGGQVGKAEEFLLAMQGIDNYRLSLYGINNGGLFQKKSHMLETEHAMNMGSISVPLQDGLKIRQRFCDIFNYLTQAGMSCEITETALNGDMNGDGLIIDEQDQTGTTPNEQDHIKEDLV